MAALSQKSAVSLLIFRITQPSPLTDPFAKQAAIARLRAFRAPPTNYLSLPLTRRAAVLILLFADRRGDLRVVLTIRSATLKNYAGHAALPGGKADSVNESAWATARREAEEEIGLPREDYGLGKWTLEPLAELPANLAVTELGVRPCVGFLKPRDGNEEELDPARDLLPRLDAREVECVFTAPFEGFLMEEDEDERIRKTVEGKWYQGTWVSWHEERWRMHQFYVPKGLVFRSKSGEEGIGESLVVREEQRGGERAEGEEEHKLEMKKTKKRPADGSVNTPDEARFRVFGMTARILVDAARVAYGREPEFEHNSHFGDEDMIAKLMKVGRLSPIKRAGDGLTREVMQKAKKAKI